MPQQRKPKTDADLPEPKQVDAALQRSTVPGTPDQMLWDVIKDRTAAIRFNRYSTFIDSVLCSSDDVTVSGGPGSGHLHFADEGLNEAYKSTFQGHFVDRVRSYDVLKLATELFLMMEAGVALDPSDSLADFREQAGSLWEVSDPEGIGPKVAPDLDELRKDYLQIQGESFRGLPYVEEIVDKLRTVPRKDLEFVASPNSYGILRDQMTRPIMVELIWSYWMEQGMLHQAVQALAMRFQNKGTPGYEALGNLEIDPLRGVSNLLWGYIQDEAGRLSVQRRASEYEHSYGLVLTGRAVPQLTPADSRPEFLRAFHDLLATALAFYQADDDMTVATDGFPVVNALRNLHLILAEGAHNQYGDLPWTARAEMLVQQWILARPEMFMFLHGRVMVPYAENWMDRVDTMRQMLGWGAPSIAHFRDLAVFGEQLLLSVRWGAWSLSHNADNGANWARAWRTQIQTYAHAYNAVTGVDLGLPSSAVEARADRDIQPSVYLERSVQARRADSAALSPGGRSRAALGRGAAGRVLPPPR